MTGLFTLTDGVGVSCTLADAAASLAALRAGVSSAMIALFIFPSSSDAFFLVTISEVLTTSLILFKDSDASFLNDSLPVNFALFASMMVFLTKTFISLVLVGVFFVLSKVMIVFNLPITSSPDFSAILISDI